MKENLAIIPARGGSKRLPRKNILEINGRPLISYTIEHALKSGLFDQVIVSTEDSEIAKISESFGASVPSLRSDELAKDTSTVVDVCLDTLSKLSKSGSVYRHFCCLYPTSPLRDHNDIIKAFLLLKNKDANFSTGVTRYHYSPFQALQVDESGFLSMIWPEIGMKQSQYQPSVVVDNGSMYWAKVSAFCDIKDFYGPRHVGYEMPQYRSIDINVKDDLDRLKWYMENEKR